MKRTIAVCIAHQSCETADTSTRRTATSRSARHARSLLCVVLLGWALAACGARQAKDTSSSGEEHIAQVFEMDTMVIRASADDYEELPPEDIDLNATFEEANAYFQAEDYTRAIRLYKRVLNASDALIWMKAALYNIGLSYENMQEWERSARTFDELIDLFPTTNEGRDAYFRLGEVLAQLGEFQRIVPLMTEVLQRPDLSDDRRIEGLVRKGTAHVELREFAKGENVLRNAIDFDERTRQRALEDGRRYERGRIANIGIAQAKYLIGRIYHEIFSEIRMVLPVERYKVDLADKDALFHQAIKEYTAAVRTGNRYWAPQAGFQIGKLYEDYYFDILASEVPQNFSQEQRDIYFEELRKFLAPGLKSTIKMYERALGMAYRMGSQDEVVEDLLEHILALQAYQEKEEGWSEEHVAVFEGRHPHSPNPARDMVFRDEVRR